MTNDVTVACLREQECNECIGYAGFYDACGLFLEEQYNVQLECFDSTKILKECFCTSDDIGNSESTICQTNDDIGAFKADLAVCSIDYSLLLSAEECEFVQALESCRAMKKARKKALNFSDQREYYGSDSCRRWFWDDKEDWKAETAMEQQECEQYMNALLEEVEVDEDTNSDEARSRILRFSD